MTGNQPTHSPASLVPSHPMHTIDEIYDAIQCIDPLHYDKTRNYLDGTVTWLSPYLTHGIINTRTIAEHILTKNTEKSCYRLLYELAWREYFHRVWQNQGHAIFSDIYHPQMHVESEHLPQAFLQPNTGIDVLDEGLKIVQSRGWMHNHMRMWIAGTICNVAHTHWKIPARWLYYHLLDGDLASNTLSWQWIAGTFSHKKYIANQDNLNKFSRCQQHGTFLDIDYESLAEIKTPEALTDRCNNLSLPQSIPGIPVPSEAPKKVALHSLWNLNPEWQRQDLSAAHMLFIERKQIEDWPMAPHRIEIWQGSVEDVIELQQSGTQFIREEYPACDHWPGDVTERTFHYGIPEQGYRSFSQFWKQVR